MLAEGFQAVHEALTGRGYDHYEVSNFALPGDEARHNLSYWRGYPYVGVGCAAMGTLTSHPKALRYRNHRRPEVYLDAISAVDVSTVQRAGGTLPAVQESEEWARCADADA